MIILGLGSNIGNRISYIVEAIKYISKDILTAIEFSPVYESKALLKEDSPIEWNKDFLNLVVKGETHLTPETLLTKIKEIENKIGRENRGKWAPREIDIDILAYNDLNIKNSDTLIIPHKDLLERDFAIIPLSDVAPNWQYPGEGEFKNKTAYHITSILDSNNLQKTDIDIKALIEEEILVA